MTRLFDPTNFKKKMEALGFRSGWLGDEDVPYQAIFLGFTAEKLSYEAYRQKVAEYHIWCSVNVAGIWDSVPLRDEHHQTVGRKYRFADQDEALLFILTFA